MTDPIYPIITNTALVDARAVAAYLDMLFCHVEWGERAIGVRGIGEKGTPREGRFREPLWYLPEHCDLVDPDRRSVLHDVLRWSQYHVAAFIVPAVLHSSTLRDDAVELKHIAEFTCLVADYDSGDTGARLAYAEAAIGPATMVVLSGGTTPEGHPKRHAYWRLTEPSPEIERVADLRKALALKTGGDPSFGRAPQIIRIAGSVHSKSGISVPVRIERAGGNEIDLDDAEDTIAAMQPMPGLPIAAAQAAPVLDFSGGAAAGRMDFSAGAPTKAPTPSVLNTDIHEGGTEERNRWSEFSRTAGFEIHLMRVGEVTAAEAYEHTRTWVMLHMKPPWPDDRIRSEFLALLHRNIQEKGPMPPEIMPAPDLALPGSVRAEIVAKPALEHWDIGAWAMGEAPPLRFLVDGLVMCGVPHMLAADGGVGKTFLLLDLFLRLAAGGNTDRPMKWLGQPVTQEAAGGTVVLLTAEDGMDELHRRLAAIDPDHSLRSAAAGRFRLVPLVNSGGAFPLVAYDARRQPGQSPRWARMYQDIAEIHRQGGRVSIVGIDTMASTLHGEDISGAVVSEYAAELGRLSGELGCATIVSHHIRKTSADNPIKNLEEMRAAFRGSGAVINSVRAALGVWAATDYSRRMKSLGEKPERNRLYMLGVVKRNTGGLLEGTKTLLRSREGLLEDVTDRDVLQNGDIEDERAAWLVIAVRDAALARYPLSKTGAKGLYQRRSQLPDALKSCSRNELEGLAQRLLNAGNARLVLGALANKPGRADFLDVPDGPVARKQGYQDDGAWQPDWSMYVYDPTIRDVVLE